MILCDPRRLGRLGRRNAVWVIVIAVTAAALSVVAAGCKQSKSGSVLEGTPTGASGAPTQKTAHFLSPINPCQHPGMVPMKNESGNYGEIYFGGGYKVELLGTMLCDSNGQEFQEAKGQFYIPGNLDRLITTGPVSKISEGSVEITVNRSAKTFQLTPQTETCGFTKVAVGNMATVTSHSKSDQALSLRSGTMAWSNGPAHYDCAD
jgi:hypothetical protein